MTTFDDFKKLMNEEEQKSALSKLDFGKLEVIVKSRVKANKNTAMQYFWASFVLQIIVYALLTNTIVKHWQDTQILLLSTLGLALYIPFTIVIMTKFKKMAVLKLEEQTGDSMIRYVSHHLTLLKSFFKFKKYYELLLIPVSSIIGVVITFNLFVPGGVSDHLMGAGITLAITLVSCWMAIKKENRKNFELPIDNLMKLKAEFGKA